MAVVKGSPIDKLLKLFASPQDKALEEQNKKRRIQYLKRKYSSAKRPVARKCRSKSESDE